MRAWMRLVILGFAFWMLCNPAAFAATGPVFRDHPTAISIEAGKSFSISLRALLSTFGNGVLTWSALDNPPTWATVNSSTQRLEGNPKLSDTGEFTFRLSVRDTQDRGDITPLTLVVFSPNKRPVWSQNPIPLGKFSTTDLIQQSIAKFASDPESDPITFTKTSGPSWIQIAANGIVTGQAPAVGEFTVGVAAADAGGATPATITISVTITEKIERIVLDRDTTGAVSETLWVVDYSTGSQALGYELKTCIGNYFSKIAAAGMTSHGIYVSADAHFSKGKAIPSKTGTVLIDSSTLGVVTDFQARMVKGFTNGILQSTPTYNAYLALSDASTLEAAGFLKDGVPLHILLFSDETDMYSGYQGKSGIGKWGSKDYVSFFTGVADDRQKSLRIFGVGPDTKGNTVPFTTMENLFKVLPPLAGGEFFPAGKLRGKVSNVLNAMAAKAIEEAAFSAKARIPLTHKPLDASKIQVRIDGVDISGNTGSPDDLWAYDAASNSIRMFWNRIEISEIPVGAVLEIKYTY